MGRLNAWLQQNEPLLRNLYRAVLATTGILILFAVQDIDLWALEQALDNLGWLQEIVQTCRARF